MVEEMASAARLQKIKMMDPKALSARKVLEMATIGGARVLGLDQKIGTLEPGKRADLVIVNLQQAKTQPVYAVESAIVYAASGDAGRSAYGAFERKWGKRCPGVVRSLQEGGAELLTFFAFPKAQWKTLRTTNVIERLNEEFRRRVKTQGSLPTEDAALILLFSLVISGQVKLRRIDGHATMAAVISRRLRSAA